MKLNKRKNKTKLESGFEPRTFSKIDCIDKNVIIPVSMIKQKYSYSQRSLRSGYYGR